MRPIFEAVRSYTRSAGRFRHTVRARLTLIYGSIFLASGAAVLTVAYLLVRHFSDALTGGISTTVQIKTGAGKDGSGGVASVTLGGIAPGGAGVPPPMTRPPVKIGPTPHGAGQVVGPTAHQLQQLRQDLLRQIDIQHSAILHSLLVWSIVALVGAVLISIVLGWLMAGRALRPLRTITSATRSISARNLHERLAYAGPADEVKELADTIDRLLERLDRSFEAQRRFVANASHELRTPLARQRTLAEVALGDREASVASLRKAHERVIAAGEQQERLIASLLTLARSDRGLDSHEDVDITGLAECAVDHGSREIERLALSVTKDLEPAVATGDAQLLERLVFNLVDNAIDHNVEKGWITLFADTCGTNARIRVSNSGPEIPQAEVARLLQPFQRLGRDRTGTGDHHGLGLAIVQAIVIAHDGQLSVSPNPGGGLTVEVSLPGATGAKFETIALPVALAV